MLVSRCPLDVERRDVSLPGRSSRNLPCSGGGTGRCGREGIALDRAGGEDGSLRALVEGAVMVIIVLFAWFVARAFAVGRRAAFQDRAFPALVA